MAKPGDDLLAQFGDLDAQAIGSVRSKLEAPASQKMAPRLVLWLLEELNAELERRLNLKATTAALPDIAGWSDLDVARALGVALLLHEHTLNDIEDGFAKRIVHFTASHLIGRVVIREAGTK
jgi:hypothetical protein